MKRKLTALCLLAGVVIANSAFAQVVTPTPTPTPSASTVTYDLITKYLTIPTITAGDYTYTNLVIRLSQFEYISGVATPVGQTPAPAPTPPAGTVSDTCTAANFTAAKFAAITLGMTLDQVNQTIGCKFDPAWNLKSSTFSRYSWLSLPKVIQVFFDVNGTQVTATSAGGTFKTSVGI